MVKPIREFMFRPIEGMWKDVRGDGAQLCDVLAEYEIIVDDRTQFARLYDYTRQVEILYRASAGKVTIQIYKIG